MDLLKIKIGYAAAGGAAVALVALVLTWCLPDQPASPALAPLDASTAER